MPTAKKLPAKPVKKAPVKGNENYELTGYSPTELVKQLAFSEDNVLAASRDQAMLFYEAVELRIAALRKYLLTKNELATVRAAASISIRNEAVISNERITEGGIEAHLLSNPGVIAAQEALLEAETEEEARKLLLEAYRHRRDSLRVIAEWRGADLRAQQAHELATAGLEEARIGLQKRYAED